MTNKEFDGKMKNIKEKMNLAHECVETAEKIQKVLEVSKKEEK